MSLRATDISVVIAGPARPQLEESVRSVRALLPGAEVVLSTWKGTDVDVDVDVLVQSADPGTAGHNTNRMITSAHEGVRRCTRPYVLKLRSDALLTNTGFLDWWDTPLPRGHKMRVFEDRLLTVQIATRPSRRMPGFLFHPSDCVHFGNKVDVAKMWGVRKIDEQKNVTVPRDLAAAGHPGPLLWNEQSLWLAVLRAAGHRVDYRVWGGSSRDEVEVSEQSIANNFVVLEDWQFGVALPKLRDMVAMSHLSSFSWLDDWRDSVARDMEVTA